MRTNGMGRWVGLLVIAIFTVGIATVQADDTALATAVLLPSLVSSVAEQLVPLTVDLPDKSATSSVQVKIATLVYSGLTVMEVVMRLESRFRQKALFRRKLCLPPIVTRLCRQSRNERPRVRGLPIGYTPSGRSWPGHRGNSNWRSPGLPKQPNRVQARPRSRAYGASPTTPRPTWLSCRRPETIAGLMWRLVFLAPPSSPRCSRADEAAIHSRRYRERNR